jgi:DNA-binding PadR family transcriptional regulator
MKPTPSSDPAPPLKPLVFQILLSLADGERHGWALVREVQRREEFSRIMPGNFYRTLRTMLADGLIEEAGRAQGREEDERRRYFKLTALGRKTAGVEAHRLQAAVNEARSKRLLVRSRG